MTPEAWFAVSDPGPLLAFVQDHRTRVGQQPQAVDRRLRLFACAAARQVWDLLSTDARSSVQASERYADGQATRTDQLAATVKRPTGSITAAQLAQAVARAATGLEDEIPPEMLRYQMPIDPTGAAGFAARAVAARDVGPAPPVLPTPHAWHTAWTAAFAAACAIQADYVRDIFPPPRYVPQRDPQWTTSTVLALARQIYETGDFSPVPILADALQDAGCEDEMLLSCCRTRGNIHVRGNWVVDLILGRT
jgi:hypothetical protein